MSFSFTGQSQPQPPSLDDELSMDWPPTSAAAAPAPPAHAVYSHADYSHAASYAESNNSRSHSRDFQPPTHVYDYGYGNAAGVTVVAPTAAVPVPASSSPSRFSHTGSAPSASGSTSASGSGPGSDDSRAELKQLKRLIRKQHAEHEAATQSLRVALESEQARVATLESEATARRQELARAGKEVDRLSAGEQDARKRITKLQAACNELEERAAGAEARAKASKGWFGGMGMGMGMGSSILTGGGSAAAAASEAAPRPKAGPAFKQLQADMETLQGELLAKIAENQQLHTAAADSAKEHANLVQTLQHKIEEGRGRLRESEEEKRSLAAQLARERDEAASREHALSARVAALSSQVSSTLSSSSAADQAWLVQRAQYERVFSAVKRAWSLRVPFDDAARPDLLELGLDLPLRSVYSRAATVVQARAAADAKVSAEKVAHLLNNQLLKHWIDKWTIQQQGGASHLVPSAAHLAALQGLAAQLSLRMAEVSGGLDLLVEGLHRLAGLPLPNKAAAPASSISASSAAALVPASLSAQPAPRSLQSFTLLLEPLRDTLHLLGKLCALQAQLLADPPHSHGGASNAGGGAGPGLHLAQLAFAWKQLQSHLNKGAAALKALMERGNNNSNNNNSHSGGGGSAAGAGAGTGTGAATTNPTRDDVPPPGIAVLLPSTALSSCFTLPAAWLLEWLLHSPPQSSPGGASALSGQGEGHHHQQQSQSHQPAAAHVHAYLAALQALLGEVSTKFAIVSVHEYRQQPSAASSSADGHGGSGGGGGGGGDTASSAVHRSRLSELNNRLLIDLKALPKLLEALSTRLASRATQAEEIRRADGLAASQRFAQQRERAALLRKAERKMQMQQVQGTSAASSAAAAAAPGGEGEDEEPKASDPLDPETNPLAVYLRGDTAGSGGGAAAATVSRSVLSLHTRATSFLSALNRSAGAGSMRRAEKGIPYAQALQQRLDLGQLSRDFALLSQRYSDLESEHTELLSRHALLSDEHQAALERSEAQHDVFAATQMDFFEEKRLREGERRAAAGVAAQLREAEAACAALREQVQLREEEVQAVRAQLEGGVAFDQTSPRMRPAKARNEHLSAFPSAPAPAFDGAEHEHQQEHEHEHDHSRDDDELDFLPTSSHARTLDELLEGESDVAVLDAPPDTASLRSALAPLHPQQPRRSFLSPRGSGDDDHDDGAGGAPRPRSDVSDWLHQARQFEQLSKEQLERAQRAPVERCRSSYSVSTAGEVVLVSGAGAAAGVAAAAPASFPSFSDASFSTPVAPRHSGASFAASASNPASSPLFSPPFLSHVSPLSADAASASLLDDSTTSGAFGDVTVHQLDDVAGSVRPSGTDDRAHTSQPQQPPQIQLQLHSSSTAAAPSVNSWQLYQHRSRLHAAESELRRVSLHVSVLHARNSGLVAQLGRAQQLLQLLSSRAAASSATAAATLGRLQEVQLERSEQVQSYTNMMDELTERIFQLTQQLADKDARAA